MHSVAQAWLVYRITDSAVWLGWISFASQMPVFLLCVIGGTVADRFDRRRLIIGTQIMSMLLAFIMAALTLSGAVQVWHILLVAVSLGIVNAFDVPARQSFLLEMVTRQDLPNAIALNSSMFNGARMIGPAIAGIVVAGVGEGWCFFANGVSYVAVLAGLLMMNVQRRAPAAHTGAFAHIVEGLRFVTHNRPVWSILALVGTVSLVGTPYTVLLPVFAADVFGGGASELGMLMSATGLGALTAALLLARRVGLKGFGRVIATSAVCFGVAIAAFSASTNLTLSLGLLYAAAFSVMLQMAACNTLLQAMAPDALRGRVMAVYSTVFLGMAPFGGLLAGALARIAGAPTAVAIGGVTTIIVGLVFAWALPSFRGRAHELIVAQQGPAGETAG